MLDSALGFIIRGRVITTNGKSAPGIEVRAFDHNIGADDTLLGKAITDVNGEYAIAYSGEQLEGKQAANLVLCLYREARGAELERSDVIFDAQHETVKDFIVHTASVEFEHLAERIRPLLDKQGIGQLETNQIDFLPNKKRGN